MDIALLTIRLILFGVFAVAGVSKFLDPEGSKKTLRDFNTPEEFTGFFSVALPFAEIVFAVCLLFVTMSWVGALGCLILLLTFIGGMAWQMAQGKAPDCHCFGQLHSEPVGKKSLIRNIILALLAIVLLASGRASQGFDLASTTAGMLQIVLILFLVILAVVLLGYLVDVAAQQREIVRRLGILEFASGGADAVERNEAGDPSDGLPIGAPLPDISIPDINGRLVRFEHLMDGTSPFLLLFVGPQCAPCESLLPEIKEWETALAGKAKFIFISHGDVAASRKKFEAPGRVVLVEDAARPFAKAVHAKWTPTALYVDANGNIAGHIAAGDIQIRRLVDQMRSRDLGGEFVYFLGLNGHRRPNIGERVPAFSVKDVNGKEITENVFSGRRTLVAFSSPTCGHCVRLMDEVREWEAERNSEEPQLLIFTDGNADDERKLGLRSSVISDPEHRTAAKLGMRGVPSAVLIDETGTIVSEAAIGPPNIWSLIGVRRSD